MENQESFLTTTDCGWSLFNTQFEDFKLSDRTWSNVIRSIGCCRATGLLGKPSQHPNAGWQSKPRRCDDWPHKTASGHHPKQACKKIHHSAFAWIGAPSHHSEGRIETGSTSVCFRKYPVDRETVPLATTSWRPSPQRRIIQFDLLPRASSADWTNTQWPWIGHIRRRTRSQTIPFGGKYNLCCGTISEELGQGGVTKRNQALGQTTRISAQADQHSKSENPLGILFQQWDNFLELAPHPVAIICPGICHTSWVNPFGISRPFSPFLVELGQALPKS